MEWAARAHCYDAHGRALYLLILAGAQVVPSALDGVAHARVACAQRSSGFGGRYYECTEWRARNIHARTPYLLVLACVVHPRCSFGFGGETQHVVNMLDRWSGPRALTVTMHMGVRC